MTCVSTQTDAVLTLLEALCDKFLLVVQRFEAEQTGCVTGDAVQKFTRRFFMQSKSDIQNDDPCQNVAAASAPDCRTCGHYLNGLHACDLFCQKGQDCVEGSHWQAVAFAPVWKKAA